MKISSKYSMNTFEFKAQNILVHRLFIWITSTSLKAYILITFMQTGLDSMTVFHGSNKYKP